MVLSECEGCKDFLAEVEKQLVEFGGGGWREGRNSLEYVSGVGPYFQRYLQRER